ncbi:hypothetical protein PVAND_012450 [Polypedilum vanderplanki]|uniref:Uncharacterized protein n=1 Tax=Polypedilum vanderplanki TaxID=319348 RepID=A0A9J6CMH3_POLVA|nr:hypothetical protein PVAND_012450 [Polypedilum vanderplanki]
MANLKVFIIFLCIAATSSQTPNFQEMFQGMMNAFSSMAPPLEFEYPEEEGEEVEEEKDYENWFYDEAKIEETKDSDAEEYYQMTENKDKKIPINQK